MDDKKQTDVPVERIPAESAPTPEQQPPSLAGPGEVVVDIDKINELMAERRAAAREAVEQEPSAPLAAEGQAAEEVLILEQEGKAALFEIGDVSPDEQPPFGTYISEEVEPIKEPAAPAEPEKMETPEPKQEKPRRSRASKEEKTAPDKKTEQPDKPCKGRPPKADKAAPDKVSPAKPRDKVSRSAKPAPEEEAPPAPAPDPATVETAPPEPASPPRPLEEGKTVYIKLTELHPFHTFRDHPFKVVDDEKMAELVGEIKTSGVISPAIVRPEKDGSGYEIIAGHRRCHGSELAGLEELPCIVRDMSDIEAVREMKSSNKQRGDPLPSELARLLDLEVEAIKHQGGRLDGVASGDVGKRSVEIVGENNNMNYKKVMRYIRLNSLVPELLNKVDEKKVGFMPAVEISYIKPKNQRLIAVSIDGEQSSPSHTQAKQLRELDQAGKLNGDVIDGILSEKKKEDRGVIISTAELEKYFGKEVTPAKMKEQIISLLDDWKEKQPPELTKAEKKLDMEK